MKLRKSEHNLAVSFNRAEQMSILSRREKHLGNGQKYFYEKPLHIVKGEDVWLIDDRGKRFLDVYNNVAHVGHANPRVTEAITKQSNALNTNTRYLHENVVRLAERLAATTEDLNVAYFCCSGSEANDLAVQLAKAHTKHQGCIVLSNAYHGNTTEIFQLSPEDCPKEHRKGWVKTIPGPKGFLEDQSAYIQRLKEEVEDLIDSGHGVACFIADSIFSSDGIYEIPKDFLKSIYQEIRSQGGVVIADEVQSGFGRLGQQMWGYQDDAVVPDILTMGKPMGNGHPVSALLTHREMVESLDQAYNGNSYFNTFGGNPVSAAAALSVLDILEEDNLIEEARQVGSYLKKQLKKTLEENESVVEIRGKGLFLGIELDAPSKTAKAMEDMMNRGVLVGKTGPINSVIKLRPPMTFKREHADLLVDKIGQCLGAIS